MRTTITPARSSMQPRPLPRAGLERWRACLHSQQIATLIESADQALGYPDPLLHRGSAGSPPRYSEMAEEAIGRLDPALVERAESHAAMMLLADLQDIADSKLPASQRMQACRFALKRAVTVYEQVLGGRNVDPEDVQVRS